MMWFETVSVWMTITVMTRHLSFTMEESVLFTNTAAKMTEQ